MRGLRFFSPVVASLALVLALASPDAREARAEPIQLGARHTLTNGLFDSADQAARWSRWEAETPGQLELLADGPPPAVEGANAALSEPFGEYQDRLKLGMFISGTIWSEDTLIDDSIFTGTRLTYEVPGLVQVTFLEIAYARTTNDARNLGTERDLRGNIYNFGMAIGLTNNELSGETWSLWSGIAFGGYYLQDFHRGTNNNPDDIWIFHAGPYVELDVYMGDASEVGFFVRGNGLFLAMTSEDDNNQTLGEFGISTDSLTQRGGFVFEVGFHFAGHF